MSIYPGGRPPNLRYLWEIAAYDLPIPDRLLDIADAIEWDTYVQALPPARLMKKLAEALDEFHQAALPHANLMKLPPDQQVRIFSKWRAASNAADEMKRRLEYLPGPGRGNYVSEIDEALFFIAEFLDSVDSRETKLWTERRRHHGLLDHNNLAEFADHMFRNYAPKKMGFGPQLPPVP
jgi:hypothetical protein